MKKGISILLVLSLLASILVPFPVIAGPAGTGTPIGDLPVNTSGVTGTGGVVVIDTFGDVLGGSLPTAANLDFIIDPLGLMDLTAGDEVPDEPVSNVVDFGTDGDSILRVYNTSSVPVVVTATLSATATNATVVSDADAVTAGDTTARNVLFWMEPNVSMQTAGDTDFEGLGQGIAITGTSTSVQFRLESRPHRLFATGPVANLVLPVELRPTAAAEGQYGTSFSFGGVINTNAGTDWSNGHLNNVAMQVNALFVMTRASAGVAALPAETAYMTDGSTTPLAYGMLASYSTGGDTYTEPTLIDLPEGLSGGGGSGGGWTPPAVGFQVQGPVNIAAGSWQTVPFIYPNAESRVQSVTHNGFAANVDQHFRANGTDRANSVIAFNYGASTREIVVTLNDSSVHTITLIVS